MKGNDTTHSVPFSFSNCFWGLDEKGVDVLHDRLSDAKDICEEIRIFYRERVAAEEEYARKLQRISKMSLAVVKKELEVMGNAHAEVASAMHRELEDAISTFSNSMKERRKLVQANIEKLRRTKQSQEHQLHKLKEKYEADCIKVNGFIAQQNMLMGKELDKNNTKLEKSQMSVQASNNEYKTAVKNLHETTHRWNIEWKQACDKYQDLEEERIDFLKTNLWAYANIMSTVCVSDDESCEKIRVSLEKCEVDEVIRAFVQARMTGQEIPDAPRYRNFYRKDDRDDEAGYKIAQFSRDANPQYRSSTPQYQLSDDESIVRPSTGISRHDDSATRPMTGMSMSHESPMRPSTGVSRQEDLSTRPSTGVFQRPSTGVPQRPATGVSQRPSTGVSQEPSTGVSQRPSTGVAQRQSTSVSQELSTGMSQRPSTGVAQRPSTGVAQRPSTDVSHQDDQPKRPMTGMPQRDISDFQDSRAAIRGRPATMAGIMNESPPSSHRSRSRGGSQSPLKGVINEYPPEGITQFCRQDSRSMRQGRQDGSRHSSSSSTCSASEAPSQSTSDSSVQPSTPVQTPMAPPSPNVLHRRDRSNAKESQTQSPATSPRKSHSFWNFGSKSSKQSTPKATPPTSPLKNPKTAPTGMAMSVPSLDGTEQRTSPGNRSRRGESEDPIVPGSSVMLNIGNNVLEVNNPDTKVEKSVEEPVDQTDPLVAALEDLKIASKAAKMSSPSKQPPVEPYRGRSSQRSESRDDVEVPMYDNRPPSEQDDSMARIRPSTSQNLRSSQSQTPPSRGSASRGASRTSPSGYDTRRNTLGAPPPAHSAAEMERTRRHYTAQVQQILGSGRPSTAQIPPRSTSPRPTSRQSQHSDDLYNGRPGSSMPIQDVPHRSRSPISHPEILAPRSRSPVPTRPMSRQEYDDMRRSGSPAPYQPHSQVGMYDDPICRSPSPQPYSPRARSPGPMSSRPRSSAAISPDNPFGISIDRFGNVIDANSNPRSASPQPQTSYPERMSSGHQHAYGSPHRHDIVEGQNRYSMPSNLAHSRAWTKSQSDLRTRGKYTQDGRVVLFVAKALYDYSAAIPEECSFRKGDIVLVTKAQDDGWWVAEVTGTRPVIQGLVPSNFFKTIQQN